MSVNPLLSGVSQVSSPLSTNNVENKRTQLQAMLLQKALQAQQTQSVELANETQGKGQILDIRV